MGHGEPSDVCAVSASHGSAADHTTWERKLRVSNLPDGCTEEKLRSYFSKDVGGEVEDVFLMRDKRNRPRRCAHVLFYDPEAVSIATHSSHSIDGWQLIVEPCRERSLPKEKATTV